MSTKFGERSRRDIRVLAPEELAFILLDLAREQGAMFHPDNMSDSYTSNYPTHRWPQIEIALSEAWQWLRINMLIVPAAGNNGRNAVRAAKGHKVAMLIRHFAAQATLTIFDRFLLDQMS